MSEKRVDPKRDQYDTVVIGSGLGGLTAAAILAHAGWRVLLVERGEAAGGYAHSFRRGPYILDPACHFTADRSLYERVLEHLGVGDRAEIISLRHFYNAHLPDREIEAPLGFAKFLDYHIGLFPHEEKAIRAFLALCAEVHAAAHHLPPRLGLKELDAAVKKYPRLFQYEKATYKQVLDEFFTDDRLKSVFGAVWPYVGSPPSTMSFLTMAQTLILHVAGTIYFRGSFQSLVDAIQFAFERDQGELLLSTNVEKIVVENGTAKGVVLEGGRVVTARSVISNADARHTFERLVGPEHMPAGFMKRLRRMEPSLSAFVVFTATKLDMRNYPVDHETFLHESYDHEESYRRMQQGHPGGLWMNVPSLADPSLAPSGHHVVSLTSLVPYDIGSPWEKEKERFAKELISAFRPLVPELAENCEILGTATPLTLERYAGNSLGATYGWANIPSQVASRRLGRITPVQELFLAGHWTHPGSGTVRAMVSGMHTAMMMLETRGEPLPVIEPDVELPPW